MRVDLIIDMTGSLPAAGPRSTDRFDAGAGIQFVDLVYDGLL